MKRSFSRTICPPGGFYFTRKAALEQGSVSGISSPSKIRKHGSRKDRKLKEIITAAPEETEALGERIGRAAPSGSILAFTGDLGAGKTTMARGIARGLGIGETVTSPTFTIVSEYEGRLRLRHMDAWRLGGDADFAEIGGPEMLGEPGTVALVEWSERLPGISGPGVCRVDIRVRGDGSRSIRMEGSWLEEAIS